MVEISNIFNSGYIGQKGKEHINNLLSSDGVRVEIITSFSAFSPKDFWYDQSENEFVTVCKGRAALNIEGKILKLKKGDYIIIPSGVKHRVEYTSSKCVWLCIYYK